MFAIVHVVKMAHMVQENELGQPPTLAKINANLLKQKGTAKLGVLTQFEGVASPSMNMVRKFHKT